MNANCPIGVFDSGTGGLTVAKAISRLLPNEQIVYFADSDHLPFGDKSHAAIKNYSFNITEFLLQKNCKAIVVACNTASAVAFEALKKQYPNVPIIDVIDPVVQAVTVNEIDKIGVIGTKVTIDSKVYENKLKAARPDLEINSLATRSLVPIIEEGLHKKKHLLFALIDNYLGDPPFSEVDGLILGCTHYPLIKEEIEHYYNNKTKVFDAPSIVAEHLKTKLAALDLLSKNASIADTKDHQFFASDLTSTFEETAKLFFGKMVEFNLKKLGE